MQIKKEALDTELKHRLMEMSKAKASLLLRER
jgi:hypothetical protein